MTDWMNANLYTWHIKTSSVMLVLLFVLLLFELLVTISGQCAELCLYARCSLFKNVSLFLLLNQVTLGCGVHL